MFGGKESFISRDFSPLTNDFTFINVTIVESCLQGAETQLKHAVATMRPVSVAFEVVNDFRLYNGGVYTSLDCHTGPQVKYSLSAFTDRTVSAIGNWIEF